MDWKKIIDRNLSIFRIVLGKAIANFQFKVYTIDVLKFIDFRFDMNKLTTLVIFWMFDNVKSTLQYKRRNSLERGDKG